MLPHMRRNTETVLVHYQFKWLSISFLEFVFENETKKLILYLKNLNMPPLSFSESSIWKSKQKKNVFNSNKENFLLKGN